MKQSIDFTTHLDTPLFRQLQEVAEEEGLETYVVGGFVRDQFLKRGVDQDVDIVVVGSGIALAKALHKKMGKGSKVQVFKTYGTAMLQWDAIQLEFVGARKESYAHHSRNPEVSEGSLQDDQLRRDFTINALAVGLNKNNFGKLLDPFNGLGDLENKCLRTPQEPEVTYQDDPLRMLRAIRFATQLGFTIVPESLAAITKNAARIEIISKERIVVELHKILAAEKPSVGFTLLEETGLLPYILPELVALKGVEEKEGQKHKDNFYHTLEVVDNIAQNTENVWLRWAALLHDIGKAPTKKFHPNLGWTFHNHELVGSKMVFKLFKRLKMPLNDKMKFVQKLVYMSSRPIVIAEEFVTDAAVRRLVYDAGDSLEDLMTLCEADITTKNPKRFARYHNNFKIVRQKMEEVEAKDKVRNFQPPVSGAMIMDYFNLPPSKPIGLIKEAIKEAILEGEIPNAYEAAWERMKTEGKKLGLQAHEKQTP